MDGAFPCMLENKEWRHL